MEKTCVVCGRTSSVDAMQCGACRSRDFGGVSATSDYRNEQAKRKRDRQIGLMDQALTDDQAYPVHWRYPLAVCGVACIGTGVLMGGRVGAVISVLGCVALGGWRILTFVDAARTHLQRERER